MSGKRTKVLRREFIRLNGRPPETRATKAMGVFRWWRSKVAEFKPAKPVPEMAMLVTDSHSEFRRFKRSRRLR